MSSSNLDILAYEPSPLGMICLRQRELLSEPGTVVTEITLNHEFLMSSYHTASERALAEGALSLHESHSPTRSHAETPEPSDPPKDQRSVSDLRVLIGGLGLGSRSAGESPSAVGSLENGPAGSTTGSMSNSSPE